MQSHLKRSLFVLAAVALAAAAGCQSSPPASSDASAASSAPSSALPAAEQDSCGAASHAALVGQDYKQVPPAASGKVIRVLCTTCPMTMDFNAERLNVIYEQKSGAIERLTCG